MDRADTIPPLKHDATASGQCKSGLQILICSLKYTRKRLSK